jgi:hypothetical protein
MKKTNIFIAFIAIALMIGNTACVKQKADLPPDASNFDPKLAVNETILSLKNFHGASAVPKLITEDKVITAIVTADDRGGSFYKQLMIQDSSSGIALLIEKAGLFNEFPVGRKIYVNCKGLYVGEYGNFKQIGYAIDERGGLAGIPPALISKFIVKANYPNAVPIKSYTLFDLKQVANQEAVIGTLIKIDSNAQFTDANIGLTYALPATIQSFSERTIEQCGASTTMIISTSGYVRFQNELLPTGRGTITAILSTYKGTPQLILRESKDVQFTDPIRCGGIVFTPPTPVTIKYVRELFNGNGIGNLPNIQIHGTIINSVAGGNSTAGNYFMQDESGRGINVYSPGGIYDIGDSVTVTLKGDSLIVYGGNLELKKGPTANLIFASVGNGKKVSPKEVTVKQLNDDLLLPSLRDRVFEGTLVKVKNATVYSASGFYAGFSNTLVDGTGSIIFYNALKLPYTTTPIPTSPITAVGVAANYKNTPQVVIRSLADVTP